MYILVNAERDVLGYFKVKETAEAMQALTKEPTKIIFINSRYL